MGGPAATAKPATSAVLVSGRIRITGFPAAARRCALSESNAARPTAMPPDCSGVIDLGQYGQRRPFHIIGFRLTVLFTVVLDNQNGGTMINELTTKRPSHSLWQRPA